MSRNSGRRRPRTVRVVPFLVLPLLAAAACSGGDPAPSGGTAGSGRAVAADAPEPPGDIVLASGRDVTGKGGIRQQLIAKWNEAQEARGTGFRARLVELPGSADQQRSQLLGALQSGSADYDVVNLDVTWVPEFAEASLVQPLPDHLVDADVIGSVAATSRWRDHVYAVPFNSDVGLLFYRPDHLRAAGVTQPGPGRGTTWPALQKLMETLDDASRDRKLPETYQKGWTAQLDATYEGLTVNGVEAFASATDGFTLTDAEGRYAGSLPQLEKGLDELRSRTQAAYTLPDAAQSDEADTLTDFAGGRTAFLRHWPYAYRTLHQSLSTQQLGVAPLPGKAVLGGQNLAVAAGSKRRNAALDLIEFLTGRQSERCLLDAGFAATRRSAYREDALRCEAAKPAGLPTGSPPAERTDRMPRDAAGRPAYAQEILLPALENAVQRPRTPLYGAFTQTFAAELGRLHGDKPPTREQLAKDLDTQLRRALTPD
ncbi:extracellular solute-binding protein [Streptomyces antimicrobicus]|uniref:Extracellular solute-binding protein n=1 Tax=Streptomyces antimicrobicus TaxID=2883108 RepID=A0ABS8B361_9ACTN|nr:extracellular solute-binding protein [Streptomyces antimicrobicus]MCB5179044.1 extracellular solute-binding protein [Streptomyces antimicrobicus]